MEIQTESIQKFEHSIGFTLPDLYREFIQQLPYSYELGVSGITVYSISDLSERNATYEVQVYENNYFMIGQDGDLAFFIKKDCESIFSNDLGALGSLEMQLIATSITDFLEQHC